MKLRAVIATAVAAPVIAFALPVAAQTLPATDNGGDDGDRGRIVNCYEASRNLVRRVPLWRCNGEPVSDAKAEEVRQSRIRRARRLMEPKKPVFPGLRMVSSGTGFFVSRAGDMVTNNHVVEGCKAVSAKPTREHDHHPASVVATDLTDDLAVIRYSSPSPAVARFRKPLHLAVGDKIAVIGHPLRGLVAIKPLFVTGKVRAFEPEQLERWGRFAIDADIRRGNSGGPVIDDRGYVVGVVSAKINTPAMFQRTGEVLRDIGLIIRQDRVLRFLEHYDIAYLGGEDRPVLDDDGLFALARTFVARIGCWK